MAQTTFRMAKGDTIAMPDGVAGRQLWRIERRLRSGYQASSLQGGPDRIWTHEEIMNAWCDKRLEHWPVNLAGLDEALAEMLQSDIDRWPLDKVFDAQCREEYCKRVDELIGAGIGKYKAYRRAADEITKERGADWRERRAELTKACARAPAGRRKIRSLVMAAAPVPAVKLGESGVKKCWLVWVKAGRDLRALIARDHLRGDHSPRFDDRRGEQTSDRDVRCVYGAMEWIGKTVYMGLPEDKTFVTASERTITSTKTTAYNRLTEKLEELKLPNVSITTFSKFLRNRYDAFDEYRARFGPRAAYLKFHIFDRRELPERAMEEVEVDHCLLDVFVTDRNGRVARPWLTVLICRATKMIVGMHIGFDPPSAETLARAVLHAILPKVLDGTGAKHDWPCMGGFDMLITDRGLELMSEAFQRAGHRLKFAIVNLPGRSPWLKATVERFFGTLGVRVLSRLEGSTKARAEGWYDPQARARFGLAELTAKIVCWVVDDYHETEHPMFKMSPRRRWRELAENALDGGVRVPPPFKDVFRMVGEGGITRLIGNHGISFDNNNYSSAELERFRRSHDGRKPVEIIAEYFDRSFIWANLGGEWKEIPATRFSQLKNCSRYMNRIINNLARRLTPKGEDVTEETREKARLQCEEESRTMRGRRAMRFGSGGALATDVLGNDGRLAVLANGLVAPEAQETVVAEDPHDLVEAEPGDETPTTVPTAASDAPEASPGQPEPATTEATGGDAALVSPRPKQDLAALLAAMSGADRIVS